MPLSSAQQTISEDTTRFRVVIAGRRFGKTHLAIRELCWHAREPSRDVWYVAPSYKMAKQIVWRKLKAKLQELNWVEKANETELSLLLRNGSTISLKGSDNYDSLRGVGLDFIVLDEFADIDPEAWFETLRPTLSDKQGRALFIGTPKGTGNWSFDLYQNSLSNDDWTSFQYTTVDGGNVKPEEIEAAKRDLDERTFRQEYLATFETFEGRVAWAFERQHNVRELTDPDTRMLVVGVDFNVSPITAAIMVRVNDDLYVIDEIVMHSSNTQELVNELKNRYPTSKITAYPDPAGRQRKTSAGGQTDFTILQNGGILVKAPNSHNSVKDRINALNSRLCSSDGKRHLFISAKCKYTIESLEKFCYKEGTQVPDKDSGYDHIFDALSYAVDYLFPIRRDIETMMPERWGHRLA
jgi:phage terminase large subunit